MKRGITLLAATAFAFAFVANAQAARVNDLIGNEPGTAILGSDENREELINRVGSADIIDEGDSLAGIFVIDQLFVTAPGEATQFSRLEHDQGNSEFTGMFQILVESKTRISVGGDGLEGTSDDVYEFTFGPDDDFDTGDVGTMLRVWDDPSDSTWEGNLDASKATARSVVSDGDLYFGVGIGDAGNNWTGMGGDTISAATLPSTRLGSATFALNRTESGLGSILALAMLSNPAGTGEFVGTSNIGGPLAGSAWPLSSNTNVDFKLVPTPAAFGSGLAALGLVMFRRRRHG